MESLPALPEHNMQLLISQAIDRGVPVETLERLLAMAQQLDAKYAKEKFNTCMSAFQEECPIIVKSKPGATTKTGVVAYRYAPLDVIVKQVKPLLFKHGFNYSLDTQPDTKGVHAYLKIRHTCGYEDVNHVYMPFVERTAVMTDAQVEMATMTIATRRVFCNGFGIITGEEDTDGNRHQQVVTLATGEQIEEIENLVIESQLPLQGILQQCKVKSLQNMTTEQAQSVISKIGRYIARINDVKEGR